MDVPVEGGVVAVGEQLVQARSGLHARWLASAIPGAELRLFPEDGHLSLVYGREREVLGWLARRLAAGKITSGEDRRAVCEKGVFR